MPLLVFGGLLILLLLLRTSLLPPSIPVSLRGHAMTTSVWMAITVFQTATLLIYRATPNLIGYVVALIAGWTMTFSWRQLVELCDGDRTKQSHRSVPNRLFVQTLCGPLALWLIAAITPIVMSEVIWNAVSHGDIVTIHRLKACGFPATDSYDERLMSRLEAAVKRQDAKGVQVYLEASRDDFLIGDSYISNCGYYYEAKSSASHLLTLAIERDNTVITDLLLRHGANPLWVDQQSSSLQVAVRSGNVRQVRTLLHYIDFNKTERHGRDLLAIARNHHDRNMVALLQSAGAK